MAGTKKRGPPKRHWADIAKVQAWYFAVKDITGLSDYELDQKYSWTTAALREMVKEPRPRSFEGMRTSGRQPRQSGYWRGINEIVEAVDLDLPYYELKQFYSDEIWELFKEAEMSSEAIEERVKTFLERYQLEKVEPAYVQTLHN